MAAFRLETRSQDGCAFLFMPTPKNTKGHKGVIYESEKPFVILRVLCG
jgi:hypothetical protein